MAKGNTYNGWTNYQTWNVNLWLQNDCENTNRWSEATRRLDFEQWKAFIFADITGTPDGVLFSDERVNWTEIYETTKSDWSLVED